MSGGQFWLNVYESSLKKSKFMLNFCVGLPRMDALIYQQNFKRAIINKKLIDLANVWSVLENIGIVLIFFFCKFIDLAFHGTYFIYKWVLW